MALQVAWTAPFSTAFPESYVRVVKIDLDIPRQFASVEYWRYVSAAVREADQQATVERVMLPVYQTEQAPDFETYFGTTALAVEGMNPVKAAYELLKARGDFAGATDV